MGTHFYHGHMAHHKMDGLNGMIIVHERSNKSPPIPSFHVLVTDWWNFEGNDLEISNPYGNSFKGSGQYQTSDLTRRYAHDNNDAGSVDFSSALINGRGRKVQTDKLPLQRFHVAQDKEYRFRMAHTGAEYGLEISIDNHNIEVFEPRTYHIVNFEKNKFN